VPCAAIGPNQTRGKGASCTSPCQWQKPVAPPQPTSLLSPKDRARLDNILLHLSMERASIAEGMLFALDHVEAADEVRQPRQPCFSGCANGACSARFCPVLELGRQILDVIVESLLHRETSVPAKLARLYLLSDILHNSALSIPNAWKYRSRCAHRSPNRQWKSLPGRLTRCPTPAWAKRAAGRLETKAQSVLEHLGNVFRAVPGRLKVEHLKVRPRRLNGQAAADSADINGANMLSVLRRASVARRNT